MTRPAAPQWRLSFSAWKIADALLRGWNELRETSSGWAFIAADSSEHPVIAEAFIELSDAGLLKFEDTTNGRTARLSPRGKRVAGRYGRWLALELVSPKADLR